MIKFWSRDSENKTYWVKLLSTRISFFCCLGASKLFYVEAQFWLQDWLILVPNLGQDPVSVLFSPFYALNHSKAKSPTAKIQLIPWCNITMVLLEMLFFILARGIIRL